MTWTKLTGHGLPTHQVGKFGLAIAHSDPNRIYALIETSDGVPWKGDEPDHGKLWRSDDGGRNWQLVNYDRTLGGRTHYYFAHGSVARQRERSVFPDASYFDFRSTAGNRLRSSRAARVRAATTTTYGSTPSEASRMAVANDSGVSITVDHGRTWNRVQLPIAQIYHVTVDNDVPYHVLGNKQDGPSYRGPSNSRLDRLRRIRRRHPAQPVGDRRRRRERVRNARSNRSDARVVDRLRLRQRRRHRRTSQRQRPASRVTSRSGPTAPSGLLRPT